MNFGDNKYSGKNAEKQEKKMKIMFLHPDLGIGGAERLVLDIGLALKSLGHEITFLTSHHDANHCFPETTDGKFRIMVAGDWLPRQLFGRFQALVAYLRMIFLAFYLFFSEDCREMKDCDLIMCDSISAVIPFLNKLSPRRTMSRTRIPVLFYCHFPDLLLTQRKNFLKKSYRYLIDWFEEYSTGCADRVFVNSNFTAQKFRQTFTSLANMDLRVLYPICNFSALDSPTMPDKLPFTLEKSVTTIFLSINRFERKKNLLLAIKGFQEIQEPSVRKQGHLIVAGGYDERVEENVSYFSELKEYLKESGLKESITLLKSPKDDQKRLFLHSCTAVIYTPQDEHFGIVPLEAMYMSRPVIACNSGGPLETIIDKETGFLCPPEAKIFGEKMALFIKDKSLAREMGVNGREHVLKKFNQNRFFHDISEILDDIGNQKDKNN